jgi:hypothetical protein
MPLSEKFYDGTALGCIGRCKVCGKAIQLRGLVVHPAGIRRHDLDRWEHFDASLSDDHRPVLSPGVLGEVGPLDEYRGQ